MTFEEACAQIPPGGRLSYLQEFPDRWSAAIYIAESWNNGDFRRGEGPTPAAAILAAIANQKPMVPARDLLKDLGL